MSHHRRLLHAAGACLLGAAMSVHAQTQGQPGSDALVDPVTARQQAKEIAQGDPARWYREDTTRQARLRNLQKEAGAALQEARNACKKGPGADRKRCEQEARAIYHRDMAQAKAQVDGQTP